jgi:hypothetical protein
MNGGQQVKSEPHLDIQSNNISIIQTNIVLSSSLVLHLNSGWLNMRSGRMFIMPEGMQQSE